MTAELSHRDALSSKLAAKIDERDELVAWLETLEGEGAGPEAITVVQAQLDRVLREISRLQAAARESALSCVPAGPASAPAIVESNTRE